MKCPQCYRSLGAGWDTRLPEVPEVLFEDEGLGLDGSFPLVKLFPDLRLEQSTQ